MLAVLTAPVAADQWARTLGVSVAVPLALERAGCGFALALVYARYFGLLGASNAPAGSRDRLGYEALRENLATGSPATHHRVWIVVAVASIIAVVIATTEAREDGLLALLLGPALAPSF